MKLFGPPDIEKLRSSRSTKKLIKAMKYDKDPSIPLEAVKALGELGCVDAVGPIGELLVGSWGLNPEEGMVATVALGEIGHGGALPYLRQALQRKEFDENLRQLLFLKRKLALHKNGMSFDKAEQCATIWIERKEHLLTAVRVGAARALGEIDENSTTDILIEALTKEEDSLVAAICAESLARKGAIAAQKLSALLPQLNGLAAKMATRALNQLEDDLWLPSAEEIAEELAATVKIHLILNTHDAALDTYDGAELNMEKVQQTSIEEACAITFAKYEISEDHERNRIIEIAGGYIDGEKDTAPLPVG